MWDKQYRRVQQVLAHKNLFAWLWTKEQCFRIWLNADPGAAIYLNALRNRALKSQWN